MIGDEAMPRKNQNARKIKYTKRLKIKGVRIVHFDYSKAENMSPGKLVAVAKGSRMRREVNFMRAKRHKSTARPKNFEQINELPEFSKPIVHINIQTGEGYCRIRELWEGEKVERLPANKSGGDGK